jgi:hypothetical protein
MDTPQAWLDSSRARLIIHPSTTHPKTLRHPPRHRSPTVDAISFDTPTTSPQPNSQYTTLDLIRSRLLWTEAFSGRALMQEAKQAETIFLTITPFYHLYAFLNCHTSGNRRIPVMHGRAARSFVENAASK